MSFPEFSVIVRSLDGYTVVSLHGELDLTTAPELEASLAGSSNGTPLILDCRKLTFLGSHGIRVLYAVRDGERRALVIEPESHIRRVIEIVDLKHLVPVFPDLEAAIRWAGKDRAGEGSLGEVSPLYPGRHARPGRRPSAPPSS